ncbi:MAG: (4Fe-4S)-binding protein [Bacteroidota bacterium]|nr:(4Fe-4S)-binding protein [Bacteroidota bacterium]
MKYKLEQPVHANIDSAHYQCSIEWRNGKFIADEPVVTGGQDQGPDPYTLLLASLASCTLITLRMYIDRKGLVVPSISVNANLFQYTKDEQTVTVIDRDIRFEGDIDDEQKEKLTDIAKACPISKLLSGPIEVRTFAHKEGTGAKEIKYKNDAITVSWKPELCKHSGRCVTQLPSVFNLKAHPWVNVDGAEAERLAEQIRRCPTGALSYVLNNSADKPVTEAKE